MAVVGMAANPLVPTRLAVIGPAERLGACVANGIAAQAPPNANRTWEILALSDMKDGASDSDDSAGAPDLEEFLLLFDLLDEEGRERILSFTRRQMQEGGFSGFAAVPARKTRRISLRGPSGSTRR